ncbi:MAG: translation initiation factor IF-2 [Capsulimonadaceae bacterium]
MSGVRIYDLAKELKVTNGDLLDMLKGLGETGKTASSTINDSTAEALRKLAVAHAKAPVAQGAPKSAAPRNGSKAPVSKGPSASISATASSSGESIAENAAFVPQGPVNVPDIVSLKDFADLIRVPAPSIQKKLMGLGVLASLNQKLSPEVVTRLAKSYGVTVNIVSSAPPKVVVAAPAPTVRPAAPQVAVVAAKPRQKPAGPVSRPPVVTIMGHVDHGKTTLLDAIRNSRVVDNEFGGITQHIGAYQVEVDDPETGGKRKITFLDTPGHEAFTAMRARGAQVTDIAVLVVAADDGIMPQTVEAINHARAAQVPIIVAVNKIDKEGANPTRVLTQLTEYNILPEAYGGDVQTVEVSAKEQLGLDDLLEKIILVADLEVDPKADPTAPATATVIEAQVDRGRGAVATILVEQGTVKMGDAVVAGSAFGKIKAMVDDRGKRVLSMGPGGPVEILGLNSLPFAGDRLEVVKDERTARQIADGRADEDRISKLTFRSAMTLEDMQRKIKEGQTKTLNMIIKGDVQGSVEAIRQSLEKIDHPEVKVRFLMTAVGGVTESDVQLASASGAIIFGFNVKVDPSASRMAEAEHIEIREYRVIYDLFDDVKKAMAGLLDPIYEESPLGSAEVRAIFRLPRSGGTIAGSYISDGKFVRGGLVRVRRANKLIFDGKIDSVRREKDDVKEVAQGYECGILIPGYEPVEGDKIECFEMRRIERTL